MLFGKWELFEEGKPMICESYHVLWDTTRTHRVIVDVYRKKKLNGMYKYKTVIRK